MEEEGLAGLLLEKGELLLVRDEDDDDDGDGDGR